MFRSKRLLVNQALIRWVIDERFGGRPATFAARTGLDPDTVESWLRDERPTSYQSKLEKIAAHLDMPLAALSVGYAGGKVLDPDELAERLGGEFHRADRGLRRQLRAALRHVHWGNMLPADGARWYRTSWPYRAPATPGYGLLEIAHEGPLLEATFTFAKRIASVPLLFDYGHYRDDSIEVESCETLTFRRERKRAPRGGRRTRHVVTWFDDWPDGFLVRSNIACRVRTADELLAEDVVERRLRDPDDPLVGFRRSIVHAGPESR